MKDSAHLEGAEAVVRATIAAVCDVVMGVDGAGDRLLALYHDPTNVRHPLQPRLPTLTTPASLQRQLAVLADRPAPPSRYCARNILVHTTADPSVVITEFEYEQVVDGRQLVSPSIWVTRVQDGKIVEARDYNGAAADVEAAA